MVKVWPYIDWCCVREEVNMVNDGARWGKGRRVLEQVMKTGEK